MLYKSIYIWNAHRLVPLYYHVGDRLRDRVSAEAYYRTAKTRHHLVRWPGDEYAAEGGLRYGVCPGPRGLRAGPRKIVDPELKRGERGREDDKLASVQEAGRSYAESF